MLFIGPRNIEVREYSSSSVKTLRTPIQQIGSPPNLDFNGWRLAMATARTICSIHLTTSEYWLDAFSTLLSLSNLIHSHVPNVRIDSSRIQRLRDFSRTNRIGEISQGLVWLHLQKQGYRYISDYHVFAKQTGVNIVANQSTPDFVAQTSSGNKNVCLIESKGKEAASTGDIKSKLKKALDQCSNGEAILVGSGYTVTKKLGYCTELSDEKNAQNSIMHFSDPESPSDRKTPDDLILRIHYAAWFYLIGDFDNVKKLLDGEALIWNNNSFERRNINGTDYWILYRLPYQFQKELRKYFPDLHLFPPFEYDFYQGFKIGIADVVIKALQRSDTITDLPLFADDSTNSYELFSDGTILLDTDRTTKY